MKLPKYNWDNFGKSNSQTHQYVTVVLQKSSLGQRQNTNDLKDWQSSSIVKQKFVNVATEHCWPDWAWNFNNMKYLYKPRKTKQGHDYLHQVRSEIKSFVQELEWKELCTGLVFLSIYCSINQAPISINNTLNYFKSLRILDSLHRTFYFLAVIEIKFIR